MRDESYCMGCIHVTYCSHGSMWFCMIDGKPAWMSLDDFWDIENGECAERDSIDSDKLRSENDE